jgi:hypothetical protein
VANLNIDVQTRSDNRLKPTDKSFVTIWQLAETVDDVRDTLTEAGCRTHEPWVYPRSQATREYSLNGLKAKATLLRKKGIPLKVLKSSRDLAKEYARTHEGKAEKRRAKQQEIKDLQTLAQSLL